MTCCFSPSAWLIAASRSPFGRENHRALFSLGPHLLFHRVQHVFRRGDVLDLVAEDFDAPGIRGLVEFVHHLDIDVGALFERPVEFDLADFAPQRGLPKLDQGEMIIADAIGRALRVQDLEVQDAVH